MKVAGVLAAALALLLGVRAGCEPSGGAPDAAAAGAVGSEPAHPAGRSSTRQVEPGEVCVTTGEVDIGGGRLLVTDPKVRGAVDPLLRGTSAPRGAAGHVAGLRFTYRGPTRQVAPLASGRVVRQVGLKLAAQDSCNLIYVMWRLEPDPGIEVKVKYNPGQAKNSECGTRGYRSVRPTFARPLLAPRPGSRHALHAERVGDRVVVWADERIVWEGRLGAAASRLEGPAGFRLDNVAADLELFVGRAARAITGGDRTVRCAALEPD